MPLTEANWSVAVFGPRPEMATGCGKVPGALQSENAAPEEGRTPLPETTQNPEKLEAKGENHLRAD